MRHLHLRQINFWIQRSQFCSPARKCGSPQGHRDAQPSTVWRSDAALFRAGAHGGFRDTVSGLPKRFRLGDERKPESVE